VPGAERHPGAGNEALRQPAPDRRAFLRRVGLSALVAPTLPWLACVPEPSDVPRERALGGAAPDAGPRLITRPVLLPWSEEGVHLAAAPREQPAAYVSMATRRLFVDFDYRDHAYWMLRAHISVSTGHWRIPLLGDPPKEPVTPGDALREFEEHSIRDWDPTADPAEGDIRIMRGRAMPARIELTCAPLAGGGAWYSAGPWDILQAGEPEEVLSREDFLSVGTGTRYADRDCTQVVGPVRILTWVCLEELLPSAG
jgi:hypothetical protein